MPVFGPGALDVSPRVGHLHVTFDDAPWHWVDASGEPLIIQGLPPGPHNVLIELADPTHRVIDQGVVELRDPGKSVRRRGCEEESGMTHDASSATVEARLLPLLPRFGGARGDGRLALARARPSRRRAASSA